MKKELNLKHGVILATAVLLVAGIAFAGAAAADGGTITEWNESALQAAAIAGGVWTVDIPGDTIQGLFNGLHTDGELLLSKDLTLDFGYKTVRLSGNDGVYGAAGGLIGNINNSEAYTKRLTIKNLIIDGGSVEAIAPGEGNWKDGAGGLIGHVNLDGRGVFIDISNVSISDVSISSHRSAGGLIGNGAGYSGGILYNCSIVNSTIYGGSHYGTGGLIGFTTARYSSGDIKSCSVKGVAISSGSTGAGGFVGYSVNWIIPISDSTIVDSIIKGNTVGGIYGKYSGNYGLSSISNVEVKNCVIYSDSGIAGGVIGGNNAAYSGGTSGSLDCNNVNVTDSTIVGSTFAGGFAGEIDVANNKATLTDNTVSRSCVVAENSDGVAAGFIAKAFVSSP